MPAHQMETILKEAGFTKAVSYFILELKDPSQTKTVTEELQKNKKYTVLSQQRVLDIVITFYSCHSRIVDCTFITGYCGSSGHDWYHHLHQYHATF